MTQPIEPSSPSRSITLIEGIELLGPMIPPFTDPNEIVSRAHLITDVDLECAEWLTPYPDLHHQLREITYRALLEGRMVRIYTWPDGTTGYFGYEPTDDDLIRYYPEWRKLLELEISVPQGRA